MPDKISISVNEQKYSGWTKVSIRRSMESLSGSFSLTVVDDKKQINNEIWPLKTQDQCIIRIGDDKIISGAIDAVNAEISSDTHNIRITGRDKTADLIDCSARNESISKTNILNLAKTLVEPFGIAVKLAEGVDVSSFFKYTVNSSESVFEALDKKAKELGVLIITDKEGNLIITNSSSEKTKDSLIFGQNVKSGTSNFDFRNRYSEYKVQSQASSKGGGWGGGSSGKISILGIASDEVVRRFRPLIIRAESQMTNALAKKRAEWEALIRAAKSETISVVVSGYRQTNDALWEINKLADVLIPPLYVNPATQLLITGVEYLLDENGSFTRIVLKRKDVYTSDPTANIKKQKNVGWG